MSSDLRDIEIENRGEAWLQGIPGLTAISDDTWKEALSSSTIASFPAGKKLIECGDTAEYFVLVLEGQVRVYETALNGREICLYRVQPGQVCVLTLTKLLKGRNNCAQAVAEEDVTLLIMPEEYFHRLLAESEGFRNYLMKSMADTVTEVMDLVTQVSFQRLDLRLACMIGQRSQQQSSSKLNMTHQEVANELGTTREVVSRLLKEFEKMGCIKLRRGKIEILSGDALQRLSS